MLNAIKKWAIDLAVGYAKKYMTVNQVTGWTVQALNALISKATSGVDQAKMAKVCATCSQVSALCQNLAEALRDGNISDDEAAVIIADVERAIGESVLTDAKLQELVDKLAKKIKERL